MGDVWKNGVLVTAAPDIWFLADTNGDGVADVQKKFLTASRSNQQLRVNGLYWGIDNWIYGCTAAAMRSEVGRRHACRIDTPPRFSVFVLTPNIEVIAGHSQFGRA